MEYFAQGNMPPAGLDPVSLNDLVQVVVRKANPNSCIESWKTASKSELRMQTAV